MRYAEPSAWLIIMIHAFIGRTHDILCQYNTGLPYSILQREKANNEG